MSVVYVQTHVFGKDAYKKGPQSSSSLLFLSEPYSLSYLMIKIAIDFS